MASYLKLTDKPRDLPWRAKVKGGKVRYFVSKGEAELWATEYERQLRMTGLPPAFEQRAKLTVGQLIQRYLDEVTPTKGSSVSETTVLKRLLGQSSAKRNAICDLTLAQISAADAYSYVSARQRETWNGRRIKESTIKREINTLRRIFNVAKRQWHPDLLRGWDNPFAALDVTLDEEARERRLRQGELDRLLDACEDCRGLNKDYVPIAIYLAIETGMRLQEIFNLRWDDINLKRRTIRIVKSKTDHASRLKGRTIVMTVVAMGRLMQLKYYLFAHHQYRETDTILPSGKEAFKQSWADVVKRAGISDLHFHDLRHEAGSRFDEAGLTHAEHGLMMGHGPRTMRDRYAHPMLNSIRDKLDRFALGGKTLAEKLAERQPNPIHAARKKIWDPVYEMMSRNADPDKVEAEAMEAMRKEMDLLGMEGRVQPVR